MKDPVRTFQKHELHHEKRKTELCEECRLLEVNCSLRIYKKTGFDNWRMLGTYIRLLLLVYA